MKRRPKFTKASEAWAWMAEQYENRRAFANTAAAQRSLPPFARGVCVALDILMDHAQISGEMYTEMDNAWWNLTRPADYISGYWWERLDFDSRATACALMAAIAASEGN